MSTEPNAEFWSTKLAHIHYKKTSVTAEVFLFFLSPSYPYISAELSES